MADRLTCEGCGTPIPTSKRGRPRKWCSNTCRKHTLYTGTCEECGGPTGLSGTSIPNRICVTCNGRRTHALNLERWSSRRDEIASLYRAGLSLAAIADRTGMSSASIGSAIHRLRHEYGYDLPYRYAIDGGRRVAA